MIQNYTLPFTIRLDNLLVDMHPHHQENSALGRIGPFTKTPLLLETKMLCVNELFLVLFTVSIDGPNRARGGTSHHRVIRHIVGHHRPSADDTVPTYGHPGHDHRIHSDMAVIANRHAPKPVDVRKLRVKVSKHPDASIMGGAFHTARKTHVVANGDKVGLGAKVIAIENLAPPEW